MQRTLLLAMCAAATMGNEHNFRRWEQDPCVNVEGGARYCFPSSNVCTSTHFGECPRAGTHAEAKCTFEAPGFHYTGPYEGRCVLEVDTHCVRRESGYLCGYTGNPQAAAGAVNGAAADDVDGAAPTRGDEADTKVHSAGVKSDAASVPKTETTTSSNSTGIIVGVVGVAAVAAVAFVAYRKKHSPSKSNEDNLVTPEVPHPEHQTAPPNLLGSGPLTPSLQAEKSKIFSV